MVSPQAATSAASILIVEDEGIVAYHIASVLKHAGHRVAGILASAEEVFAHVKDCRPDVILMDIHIEGPIDGIQTAAQLLEASYIPIIYLSAYSDSLHRDRAKATAAFDFLTKPVNSARLLAAVDRAFEADRSAR